TRLQGDWDGIGAGGGGTVSVDAVRADPVGHARRAAKLLHATVLLKGSTTYIVPPTDALPVYAQADGPAWLGTAGSGDVLAGLVGTLLAAGVDPLQAGALAALVHGLAGHEANPGGPVRALAVAHAIPAVVAAAMRRIGG
ncbi:MAG: NAD(P)H-hydrate dehydratase, partial [Micrococcales bacterium]|nr:NAD(P)H-hydrate dehydratase [Micrococcales bacterium]